MRRKLLALSLLLLAALPLAVRAQEAIQYFNFGYNGKTGGGGYIRTYATLAAATASDTVMGPMVPIQGARRVQFHLDAVSAGTCSLAFVYVTMKDTTEAALQTTNLWTDANGLAGMTVVDNISSNNFSDSLGGRTIELAAVGANRIPWLYARSAFRMKCCANSNARSVRWLVQVQRD